MTESLSADLCVGTPCTDDKQAFWAECRKCSHCWPIAYLPMEITAAAKLMKRAACPKCGDTKPGVAKQAHGVLLEPSDV